MSYIFTPIYSNTLTGANQNPLDPTNLSVPDGFSPLRIAGGSGRGTSISAVDTGVYSGTPAISNDQYGTCKIVAFAAGSESEFDFSLRSTSDQVTTYYFAVSDNGDGLTAEYYLASYIDDTQTTVLYDDVNQAIPVNGDVFTAGVIGTTLFVIKNDVVLYSGTCNDIASGTIAVNLIPVNATGDIKITNLVFGNLSNAGGTPYSVPDCRDYATFPNASRDVQDTLIYDVQTSSNATVPGTDSRAAGAPVDSRDASIVPLNSRTPGTFGPGE